MASAVPGRLDKLSDDLNQHSSLHSGLRDSLLRRSRWLRSSIVVLSVVSASLAFIVWNDASRWGLVVGGLTVLVTILTVVEIQAGYEARAALHNRAVSDYSRLRRRIDVGEISDAVAGSEEKSQIDVDAPAIPDSDFHRLKRDHHEKVFKSQLASRQAGMNWWRRGRVARAAKRERYKAGLSWAEGK